MEGRPDVVRMSSGWLGQGNSFDGWFKDSVHLALTRDALWSAYRTEVRRLPLRAVEQIEPKVATHAVDTAADDTDSETIRQAYRDCELNILILGQLHCLALIIIALGLLLVLGLVAAVKDPAVLGRPGAVASIILLVLGSASFVVGRGLCRFRPWARWSAVAAASAMLLLETAGLVKP